MTYQHYYVFISSPTDMKSERQAVRDYFRDFNIATANDHYRVEFKVLDWENHITSGQCHRPQDLVIEQVLEKYKDNLVLFIGILGYRFGTPPGETLEGKEFESGTQEEYHWALQYRKTNNRPEIKWFFLDRPPQAPVAEFEQDQQETTQYDQVQNFRKKLQQEGLRHWTLDFKGIADFEIKLRKDLDKWLNDDNRPWCQSITGLSKAPLDRLNGDQEDPPTPLVPGPECPYKGLAAFNEDDEPYFFGRKQFTQTLVDRVKKKPFVAVVGASGSGKSSVVLAGLFPKLRQEQDWLLINTRPGSTPIKLMATALVPYLYQDEIERAVKIHELTECLTIRPALIIDILNRTIEKNKTKQVLIFTDQFEELFTLCSDGQERKTYIDLLLKVTQVEHLHWVLTMRADFMNQALTYPTLLEVLQDNDLKIGPMNRNELIEAIVEPAKKHGVSIELPLLNELLKDIEKSPSSLPLLQFTLKQLWEKSQLGQLTYQAYQEIGGLEKALTRYADEIYNRFEPQAQEQTRQIFIQLVDPGVGTEDIRKIAKKSEIGAEKWALVKSLADKSLIVSNKQKQDQEETVEVIHEALIRNWSTLAQWMQQDRDFRRWQERLRANVEQYDKNNQDEGALLRGAVLVEAEDWLKKHGGQISSDKEVQFIQNSIDLREREIQEKERIKQKEAQEKEKRRELELAELEKRRKIVLQFMAIVLVLAVGFLLFVYMTFQETRKLLAENETKTQQTQYLLAQNYFASGIKAEQDNKLNTAWHYFVRALETYPETAKKEIRTTRIKLKASQTRGGRVILEDILEHEDAVRGIKYSSDESQLLSWSDDGTVRLWQIEDGALLAQMQHDHAVEGAVFSGDESRILSWSDDGTARLWDVSINDTPIEYLPLELEVLTGLRIRDSGQIQVLKTEQWKQQKKQYQALMGDSTSL